MQIHELTQKPLNEGVLGALASGVAKQAAQQFVQNQTGVGPDQFVGQRVAGGQRPEAALQMNDQLLQQLAKKAQESWVLTQQELAKKSNPPVASAAFLSPEELKPHLIELIKQLIGFDYTKDPGQAMGAKVAKGNIDRSVDTILGLTKEKPDQAKRPLEAAWLDMAKKGIGPMQTYAQQTQASAQPGTAPTAQLHPDAAKLTQALGQQNLNSIALYAKGKTMSKTGIPAIDGMLQSAGATLQ